MSKKAASRLLSVIVVAALAAVALITNSNYLYNVFCQIACYFILCVGLNFITGLTGQPMMGMAGVFALGSYTSAILTTKLDFSPWERFPRFCWWACSLACCWAIRACALKAYTCL